MEDVVSNTGIAFICIVVLVIILYFLDFLKSPPEDLLKMLADTCCKWYQIGMAFNIPTNTLKSIRNRENDDIISLSEVIDVWKETQLLPFTWEKVIFAVEGPIVQNMRKANEIREHLGLLVHTTE